ncbi:MAG: serine hydrolase [Eubacteriales bacterium]|nr:serine hydrolase [Eubacteriales bacterium]
MEMDISKFVERAQPLGLLGVKVSRNGEEIAQWYLEPEIRRNVYSVTKSFTSVAVGFAVQEGLLSIEEKLTDAFADDLPEEIPEYLAKAQVRDLLTMCLGQEGSHLMGEQKPLYTEDDWVKMALRIPVVYEPGTHFAYSNVGPYLAGILVQRRAGCGLVEYLMPRLFAPLGIKRPTWEVDPLGHHFGASGLMLTLSELHRFGLFCLAEGEWDGQRLLSPDWIREATRRQSEAPYGYLFWRGEFDSYRADGKYGQYTIILPERRAVVSAVSECRDCESLMRAINEELCARVS